MRLTSPTSRVSHSFIVIPVVVCFDMTVIVPAFIPDSSTNYTIQKNRTETFERYGSSIKANTLVIDGVKSDIVISCAGGPDAAGSTVNSL